MYYKVRKIKNSISVLQRISSKDLISIRKGIVVSTKDRRPLELIYYEACLDQTDATKREKYLKTYNGKMFLRNRLKSYLTG